MLVHLFQLLKQRKSKIMSLFQEIGLMVTMIEIHQDSKNVMFVSGTCKMIKKVQSYLGLPLYIYIYTCIFTYIYIYFLGTHTYTFIYNIWHIYIYIYVFYIYVHRTQLHDASKITFLFFAKTSGRFFWPTDLPTCILSGS